MVSNFVLKFIFLWIWKIFFAVWNTGLKISPRQFGYKTKLIETTKTAQR